jgi:hypothetical protein
MNADFDAEDFLGVKQENLEAHDFLAGASDSLMEKYIEAMSGAPTSVLPGIPAKVE